MKENKYCRKINSTIFKAWKIIVTLKIIIWKIKIYIILKYKYININKWYWKFYLIHESEVD